MQYAGFAGILSQIAKYPFDAAYKNSPQGAIFPLDEIAGGLAKTVYQAGSAIVNDPSLNWGMLATAVAKNIATQNIQLSRVAFNHMVNNDMITGTYAEKKLLSDKMGELRRFNVTEDLPYNEIIEGGNPYMNLEQRRFKQTTDAGEAMTMLPKLVQDIVHRWGDKPDVMMQKLQALKQNQYNTMPSLERTPLSFMKYMAFLEHEKPGSSTEAFKDYMLHHAINQAKAAAVP